MTSREKTPSWIRVYIQVKGETWSIVVTPYQVRLDNYHGSVHVHPPGDQGPPVPVRIVSKDQARAILQRQIRRRQALSFQELLEELR